MKIQKIIHSSDNNPLYLDFWPIVSRIWKEYFNIEPILLYIGDSNIDINSDYGTVIRYAPINNIPISLQTLWIRYWYPINEPDTTFMISDIDMLPLSKFYFIDQIKNFSEEDYLHINPCIDTYGLLPSCYHISKGYMFQKILELEQEFEQDIIKVAQFDNSYKETGWFNDEKYATHCILSKKENFQIKLLPRILGQNGRRIDRSNWHYNSNLVKKGYYFDAHCIRPYYKYKNHINFLTDLLLSK